MTFGTRIQSHGLDGCLKISQQIRDLRALNSWVSALAPILLSRLAGVEKQ